MARERDDAVDAGTTHSEHAGSTGSLTLGARRAAAAQLARFSRSSSSILASIIGPSDDRVIVANTSQVPWRLIAALEIHSDAGTARGTGWLAGPRSVVTCGHCILDHESGARATSIVVTPGRYKNSQPFGSFTCTRFSVPAEWRDGRQPAWDIACIHLEEPVGETLGWFGLDGIPVDSLPGQAIRTAGYSEFDSSNGRMLQSSGTAQRVAGGRLFYSADTLDGHSGAPIWIDRPVGSNPQLVALHAYDETETPSSLGIEANSGPVLRGNLAGLVAGWRDG